MAVFKFRNLNSGQATPIPPGEFSVGREDEAYVHVEDASISRKHAVVNNSDDGFFIQDVGSANGTALDGGLLIGKTLLNIGDVVYIGSVPFRLDPEVVGEPAVAPSAGMRSINRAYMRRDTEKIPAMGEPGRVMETISVEKLSAPAVSQSIDIDANDLNAITMTEPEKPMAHSLPTVQSGNGHGLKETAAPQRVLSVPTPQSHAQSRPQMETTTRPSQQQPQRPTPTPVVSQSADKETTTEPAPTSGFGWGMGTVIFLAGLGAGLFLGLYFAKLFFEMGGKAAGLP